LALLCSAALACQGYQGSGDGAIETVDVRPSRTTLLTTAYDVEAPERRGAFTGVLPSDFPSDLPLYDPSSLTDFGDHGRARFVLLFSPDAATMVRDRMRGELARSGWALIEGGMQRGTWRRGSQSLILDIQDARPGTEIRIEY
jgi:hypothetical protein